MLKNDKWILAQAQVGMISPFEPALVREVDVNGCPRLFNHPAPVGQYRKVLSYGLSSFGYDLRLSPKDFRVFRHIPGVVIDPKNFNPQHLEPAPLYSDDNGEFFIIPGHSYGLGVAVERLEIPDNITVICMGKSSYARCFSGDTKVKLVDGDYTFLELIERTEKGDSLYGFGVNADRRIIVQELVSPRFIENASMLRIELDSGQFIDATPDHIFLLRNGEKKQAQHLCQGDSLHAIYEYQSHGYPSIFDPVYATMAPNRLSAYCEVHRMVARDIFCDTTKSVHHKDGNKNNNHPSNLELLTRQEHAKLHNKECQNHIKGGQAMRERYLSDPTFAEYINSRLHSDETKEKAFLGRLDFLYSEENKNNLDSARIKRWSDPSSSEKQSIVAKNGVGAMNRRNDVTEESVVSALLSAGTIRGAAKILKVDRSAFRRFPKIMADFRSGCLASNHKVRSVSNLAGIYPSYCLTAPTTGNFALASGVFVNNCSLIANTTPGEAGWRGHLTLEFSNSSPADCRIYANEGIVQLLFLEGDSPMVSYEDRRGKYQDQGEEVTFAKV